MLSNLHLYPALLLRRYKRFLADVRLPDGSEITVHCPNTGSMKNCVVEGSPCWYSLSASKARKYPQTLEVVTTPGGYLAGINTGRANALVADALVRSAIPELASYGVCRREQVYGKEKSRIDLLLTEHPQDQRPCYVEIKNVTLMESDGQGFFPDAISERGSKHLRELIDVVQQGQRAVLLFCVQHTGIRRVSAAAHIDPVYARTLRDAHAQGVEILAYGVDINPAAHRLNLTHPLLVEI